MEEGSPTKKDEIIMGESVSTIQYGYITVEHATEELLFEDIWRFFLGKEQIIREDKMVVEYRETASIYDVDSIVCDTISVCDVKVFDQILPLYFYYKDGENRRFYNVKTPHIEEGWVSNKYRLNMKPMFNGYKNYKKAIPSRYNCIYTYNLMDVFSLMKIVESRERSAFLLAYDSIYIGEKEATYMAKLLLREQDASSGSPSEKQSTEKST